MCYCFRFVDQPIRKFTDEELGQLKIKRDHFFGQPHSDKEIDDLSKKNFANSTACNYSWVVSMYRHWRYHCNQIEHLSSISVDLDDISTFNKELNNS